MKCVVLDLHEEAIVVEVELRARWGLVPPPPRASSPPRRFLPWLREEEEGAGEGSSMLPFRLSVTLWYINKLA